MKITKLNMQIITIPISIVKLILNHMKNKVLVIF